ncbi:IS5 family transposase [Streptomyces sp. Je 1-4]|uniref:IS5 family transposase n=1 Tax=unclassified Streptomyces TaxID=2593676 RepID=UPI0021D8E573|nr:MULTISPECIES: IS5 family transposase [unclassified Streptomyces]UYB37772.1 IS5 family transposase [Streptomyces sp. Je 1-4]UZQ33682.1 IS5 family transposase [Streptomyces sp. Je 1-4] [Streptomyces sp. Je 1-4 4N24]UZQ41100.1 IS5 family transposase [Streptomyces sp. Je 1-4] [Streptomyces sp. Je 1-4 4N24_ara]
MVRRHELTDAQWQTIEALLPANGKPGGQWADHRRVINGVLFRARTGVPWPDLPERYGPWQTVYERHRRWSADGTWQQILTALQIEADATDPDEALTNTVEKESVQRWEWAVNIDSTSCRAHQHAAGARRRPPHDFPQKGAVRVWKPGREALGRSRGGLTSKVHLLADDRARPLTWQTSPGQQGDSPMFIPVLEGLRIRRRGPGRPRSRPDRVRGDKAYSSYDNRAYLRRRSIKATIAQPDDQRAKRQRKGSAGGRPPAFDKAQYRHRSAVERCVSKWKQYRAVASRYDKRDYIFNGTLTVAAIVIWLRDTVEEPSETA